MTNKFELSPQSLQKTAQLLISGGDARLALNQTGANKYGCTPFPDDDILAFSSSTASPISTTDFWVANVLRKKFEQADFSVQIHTQEVARQKNVWRELLELNSDVDLIFSTSGTDLHQAIAQTLPKKTRIIMVESNETGSGVAAALKMGKEVEVCAVALREKDGTLRSLTEIDADVIALTQQAILKNDDVLLILVDQSKTGKSAPSPQCAISLKQRYSNQFNVLVDACQFRLSKETLHAYLQQEFMIALTGSKFLAAPSFSAMLILPCESTLSFEQEMSNFGLLLRMEIALQNYRAFSQLSNTQIGGVIEFFAKSICAYLQNSPYFLPLEETNLAREGLIQTPVWDTLPTIFPFFLMRKNAPLSVQETFEIYQKLPTQNPRCQIGQPVLCGEKNSALRLCLSAPLITKAAQNQQATQNCIQNGLLVLKTLEKHI